MRGKKRLEAATKELLAGKQDKPERIHGKIGFRDDLGNKIISVPNKNLFIYVRVRGRIEEVIEALNDKVALAYDRPVILDLDETSGRYYKVVEVDRSKYQDWDNVNPGMAPHGPQHSFNTNYVEGLDVVWVYKRQIVQPMLCRPTQPTRDMTVYVESDYYYDQGSLRLFAGETTTDLTPYRPAAANDARFVLVCLDTVANALTIISGVTFDTLYVTNLLSYLPSTSLSSIVPIAAILVRGTTTTIGWAEIWDLRVLLNTGTTSGGVQGHLLDPAGGVHTGSLPASYVSVTDTGNYFTGVNTEMVFQEIGNFLDTTVRATSTGINTATAASHLWFVPTTLSRFLRARVNVTTPFNAPTATLKLGTLSDNERYLRTSDTYLGTGVLYEVDIDVLEGVSPDSVYVTMLLSGSPNTLGAADVMLEYKKS